MNIQEFRDKQNIESILMDKEWKDLIVAGHPAARAISVTSYLLSELVGFHAGWEKEWVRTGKPRHYARGTT